MYVHMYVYKSYKYVYEYIVMPMYNRNCAVRCRTLIVPLPTDPSPRQHLSFHHSLPHAKRQIQIDSQSLPSYSSILLLLMYLLLLFCHYTQLCCSVCLCLIVSIIIVVYCLLLADCCDFRLRTVIVQSSDRRVIEMQLQIQSFVSKF